MTRLDRGNSTYANYMGALVRAIAAATLLPILLASATAAHAQGNLQLGQTGRGSLSSTDPKLDDDSYFDLWSYHGKSGETIKVTLRSTAFDAYLTVGQMVGTEFHELAKNDDGAGGTDSKVVVTLPEDGDYAIRANTLSAGETGDYTIVVEQGDPSEVEVASTSESGSASATEALPEPTSIHAGQTLSGTLSDSDPMMDDSSHYDLFSFTAKRGQRATVTMRSKAFDSYLAVGRITDGSFSQLDSDDDSGGGEDAQVGYNITRDGEYVIRVNSLFKNVSGEYTVQLQMGEAPPPVVVTPQPIQMGQTVTGELSESDPQMDDESHYDLWSFSGKRGDKIVITMKSAAFDTYLGFGQMQADEFSQIESDDDSAGGTDSQITVTLDADGEYVIRANSLASKGYGAYTLNLTRAH